MTSPPAPGAGAQLRRRLAVRRVVRDVLVNDERLVRLDDVPLVERQVEGEDEGEQREDREQDQAGGEEQVGGPLAPHPPQQPGESSLVARVLAAPPPPVVAGRAQRDAEQPGPERTTAVGRQAGEGLREYEARRVFGGLASAPMFGSGQHFFGLDHLSWPPPLRLAPSTRSVSRTHWRRLRRHGAPGVPGRAPVPADWYCFGWRRCCGAWCWQVRQHPRQHRLTSHSSRTRQVASA